MKACLMMIILLAASLQGCSNKYACKGYPQNPSCLSATEAYRATDGTSQPDPKTQDELKAQNHPTASTSLEANPRTLRADRSHASLLRIWTAAYENSAGDLEGSRYLLSEIEPRHWKIGHNGQAVPKKRGIAHSSVLSAQKNHSNGDPGGFPLFPSKDGPTRLRIEEVDESEP